MIEESDPWESGGKIVVHVRLLSVALIMAGIMISGQQTGMISPLAFTSGHFLWLLLGLLSMLLSIAKPHGMFALLSGIWTALALFWWGKSHVHRWPDHFSTLIFLLGAGVLFRCVVEREPRTLLIGSTLMLCGVFASPVLYQIPVLATLAPFLNHYWAILLVILGVFLLARQR